MLTSGGLTSGGQAWRYVHSLVFVACTVIEVLMLLLGIVGKPPDCMRFT